MLIPAENRTCYDVIGELDAATQDILDPGQQYYVLGGIATAAIKHPDSVFDHQTNRLIAAVDSGEPILRNNDTRRDIDLLVLDILTAEQAKRIRQRASIAIGKQLVVSVFGLTEHQEPNMLYRTVKSIAAWTSVRTLADDGTLRYELHPLQQEVSRESYSPWALQLPNGHEVSILNPAAHMLAYYMRSISGLRNKDAEKVEEMRRKILNDQNFKEQIFDGPLQSWQQFADDVDRLGNRSPHDEALPIGAVASAFEVGVFRKKSELLRFFEANPTIVKYAQKGLLQAILRPIIGSH
jgi:hypothetical protein